MKRFKCGLVVGKFSPLHRGHELVIRRAIAECEDVIVLSYSNPEFEGCEPEKRSAWIAELLPTVRSLVVTDDLLRTLGPSNFPSVPSNDAPDATHREFCAFLCDRHMGARVDAVFTSEDYGDGFAEHLTNYFRKRRPDAAAVEHVCVDQDRAEVAISGSRIRADVHAHRDWLSPCVYASFVRRICVLGGESSGKSMLTAALGRHFQTAHVAEFGRELWEQKNGKLVYDDLLHIAREQIAREEAAARCAHRYLFCDTSPLTTLFYSLEMFGRADPALRDLALRPYDVHVLCAPDFEFVQDGTRRDAAFRQRQHAWYLEQLAQARVPFLLAEGSLEARVQSLATNLNATFPR